MSTTDPLPAGSSSQGLPQSLQAMAHVAIRLPPFWNFNPKIWFLQAEAQFQLAGITTQATQYRHVVAVLPPDVALEVADILSAPPTATPYDQLKSAILQRTMASERKRLQQLLTAEELGDRRPSQLLRAMQSLIGDRTAALDESLLRELFMQRLPAQVQMILSTASSLSLPELAQHADKIMEVTGPSIAAFASASSANPLQTSAGPPHSRPTSSQEQIQALRDEVRQLSDTVAALARQRQRPPYRRSRSSSRNRRRGHSPSETGFCYYHDTFGAAARKCQKPCAWSGNSTGQH